MNEIAFFFATHPLAAADGLYLATTHKLEWLQLLPAFRDWQNDELVLRQLFAVTRNAEDFPIDEFEAISSMCNLLVDKFQSAQPSSDLLKAKEESHLERWTSKVVSRKVRVEVLNELWHLLKHQALQLSNGRWIHPNRKLTGDAAFNATPLLHITEVHLQQFVPSLRFVPHGRSDYLISFSSMPTDDQLSRLFAFVAKHTTAGNKYRFTCLSLDIISVWQI